MAREKKQKPDKYARGVKAKRTVFTLVDGMYPDQAAPGEYELTAGDPIMMIACPGCGHVSGIRVGNPKPADTPSWAIAGDPNSPTLSPSINCVGCCGWHGYLRNGVFDSI